MAAKKPDISPDDRGEPVSQMEPLSLSSGYRHRNRLIDLAFELVQKSAALRSSLPPALLAPMAAMVRSMNCYYSNLIEGHNTHPVDIDRALRGDYSGDARKRDLQLEACAHIAVQQWIDQGGLRNRRALSVEGILEIHRRFAQHLPPGLLWTDDPHTNERIPLNPGEPRHRAVQVGRHIAISPGAVPRFLNRFAEVYSAEGKTESILAAAAAHHRLLWIHPFLDGNGRVARLMSHAQLLELLDTGAAWSVARGLAHRVADYKRLLADCDQPRRNHLDGRGALSEEALGEFTEFFLRVCLDQVTFMERLMQPERLRTRILLWAAEEMELGRLPAKAGTVLEAVLYRFALPRAEVAAVIGTGDRQARRVVSALTGRGVLASDSNTGPLRLAFPAALAGRWLPGLFPDHDESE